MKKHGKIISFERGRGCKASLGLGKRETIKKWFEDLNIDENRYDINPDLSVTYYGNLNLINSKISHIPENLNVLGSLDLEGNPIEFIPEGLNVMGFLDIKRTKITSLPEGLRVGGDLFMRETKITYLPESLKVGLKIFKDF